jgi:hypothetical protein
MGPYPTARADAATALFDIAEDSTVDKTTLNIAAA